MKPDMLCVRKSSTGCTYNIQYDEVAYISIDRYLLKYHTVTHGDFYVASGTLDKCCSLLPDFFCRLNRNLVVNMNFVRTLSFRERYVVLTGIPTPFNISASGARIAKLFLVGEKLANRRFLTYEQV